MNIYFSGSTVSKEKWSTSDYELPDYLNTLSISDSSSEHKVL